MPNLKFQAQKAQLEETLEHSVFRKGISATRFGLIPEAPSDHLPVQVNVDFNDSSNSSEMGGMRGMGGMTRGNAWNGWNYT